MRCIKYKYIYMYITDDNVKKIPSNVILVAKRITYQQELYEMEKCMKSYLPEMHLFCSQN